MKHLVYLSLGLLWCLAAGDALAAPAAETAGQVLAKLAKMTPEQRQKTLVEKAKAEAEVSFYSSLQAQQIDPFIQAFRKRYPFVKVNPYRVSGNRQVIKIQTEMNAGNHLFDVTNGSAEQASALKKIGAIAKPDDVIFTADLPKTRSGKIMRRLLRDIAEGKALGDTTTLADPKVVEKLKEQYQEEH